MENDKPPSASSLSVNRTPLSPVSFLHRAADVHPDRAAVVHHDGAVVQTWRQTYQRCRMMAAALRARGIDRGDTVSVVAPNIPAVYEAHYGVPMCGALLNTINTRLDARTVAHILSHARARLILVDSSLTPLLSEALALLSQPQSQQQQQQQQRRRQRLGHQQQQIPQVVVVYDDKKAAASALNGAVDYESFLREGNMEGMTASTDSCREGTESLEQGRVSELPWEEDEPISVSYTSGTTSSPKGVVTTHRGAYLASLSNIVAWGSMTSPPRTSNGARRSGSGGDGGTFLAPCVYLWTLPMFHCNGWCFTWATAAISATSVCLRQVNAEQVYSSILRHGVTHFCAAPVVLNFLLHFDPTALLAPTDQHSSPQASSSSSSFHETSRKLPWKVHVMTAGAAPPPSVLGGVEAMGFEVLHAYGLTETYGPSVICEWKGEEWDGLGLEQRARVKSRQGVRMLALEGLAVVEPATMRPVPRDGSTMGEVMMRGNMVMTGYLHNAKATKKAFEGGWFHSGDVGVWHPDGYIEIKDRSKDIIISGGENISSIEVEAAIYRHPAVLEAAVVACPDETWGEIVCAFVVTREKTGGQENPGTHQTTTEQRGRGGGEGGQQGRISPLEESIVEFCRDNLPRFMAPRRVVVMESLPKTSTGKVQKHVLRSLLLQEDSGDKNAGAKASSQSVASGVRRGEERSRL